MNHQSIPPISGRISGSVLLIIALISQASGAVFYLSPSGDDRNPGTSKEKAFQTAGHAVDQMKAGDGLIIRDGCYAEPLKLKSGISLKAENPRKVVFSGTNVLRGDFEKHSENVYKIHLGSETKQVFYKNEPMTWARWPNLTWSENWIGNKMWESSSKGTGPGVLKSDAFSELKGMDLAGAYCFLRYSKGNSCYSRPVKSFDGETLQWDDSNFYSVTYSGEDGRRGSPSAIAKGKAKANVRAKFFLAGSLDLLDSPGEWFVKDDVLYFHTPDGEIPRAEDFLIKTRDFSIEEDDVITDILIDGIDFFATSVNLTNQGNKNITFRDSQFTYIGTELLFIDIPQGKKSEKPISVAGTSVKFEKCLFAGAHNSALILQGALNSVENCVFMESNRHGNFQSRAIRVVASGPFVITRNTFFNNCGDAILIGFTDDYKGEVNPQVSYNNLFNAGLYNSDVSGVYMPNLSQFWTEVHHNWVHNCHGNGVRLDQAGEQLTVHHNVFWASKRGLNIEGYGKFNIYNNTSALNQDADKLTRNVVPKRKGSNEELVSNDTSFPPIIDWNVLNNLVRKFEDVVGPSEVGPFDAAKKAGKLNPEREESKSLPIADRGLIKGNLTEFPLDIFKGGSLEKLNLAPSSRKVEGGAGTSQLLVSEGVTQLGTYRGAYSLGQKEWAPGSDWMPFGLAVPATMEDSEEFAKKYKTLSVVPKVMITELPGG
ncbi:right-handed parallel beta-helix repeat-containing protein [Luteolibacter sp. AS25]|uniref:right-handed parallel beta-helix repeat-containing protein n=1 Tax=Luteolibacter sp. AS25 TaxID=3135776 RepID=UPI00398A62FD